MQILSRSLRVTDVLRPGAAVVFAIATTLGTPSLAQESAGPVNFFLWNNGPGQTFDEAEWMEAIGALSRQGYESSVTLFSDDPGKMPKMLNDAKVADPAETVIVLTTLQIDTADALVFADQIKKLDDAFASSPDMAGSAVFVDAPLCRVMQPPLKSTEYAPAGLVITGTEPAARLDCYTKAAEVHFRRSRGWDLDADGNRIVAVDTTAARAQEMMPPALSMGWLLVDTADPDRRKKRATNVFAPGDEILIRTTLDYIHKRGAGLPGARFEIELDIEVKAVDGTLIERLEDVYRYEGEVRHRVPVDADYFRNWIVASVRLEEPGAYKLMFLLTDRMAPADKQIAVPIDVDVVVE
jgi:hypothetical protein